MTVVNTVILVLAGLFIFAIVQSMVSPNQQTSKEETLPYYTTAGDALSRSGSKLFKDLHCRDCHTIWSVRNITQFVPAPSLDGIGSLRSEEWLYAYFSAENPQEMLPTRMKKKYQMPSYAHLSDDERMVLARYFASLNVRSWYLEETRKAEQQKLTGK